MKITYPRRTLLKYLVLIALFISFESQALVTSPIPLAPNESLIEVKIIREGGLIEPNENRQSFQPAKIDIYQLAVSHALGNPFAFGQDHFVRLEYRNFISGKEEFYAADRGQSLTATYGFNFVHTPAYSAGLYAGISPVTQFNQDKFSVPRVDLFHFGLTSGLEINSNWFLTHSIHYGSGIPDKQNSYISLTNFLGYKTQGWSLKLGPYLEFDITERADANYDAKYSAAGTSDRIKAAKFGILGFLEYAITAETAINAGFIQKQSGYDAVATNALILGISTRF